MNRHVRDNQFLKAMRGLQGRRPDDDMAVLIAAIDAVADATLCTAMQDGVCYLDKTNECCCRDAAERVMGITLDAEKEGKFQP
jgi:hypothetical protein